MKTRYLNGSGLNFSIVVVWLKIWKHDIKALQQMPADHVVVWLKIWKHDIYEKKLKSEREVVVWLKIWKHDIECF